MTRRVVLAVGGPAADPGGPLPPDPNLTEPRHIVGTLGINQNVITVPEGGQTWRTVYPVIEDSASLTLAYSGFSQGFITDPMVFKVAVEIDGVPVPLTFDGLATASLPFEGNVESDPLPNLLLTGDAPAIRLYAPGGQTVNLNNATTPTTVMAGEHLTDTWSGTNMGGGGPMPIAVIGACRASVVVPAVYGDSIVAQGRDAQGWIRKAAVANNMPVLVYGRNATRFTGDWPGGDTLRAATHLLVEFGVNDMSATPTVATMWGWALGSYDEAVSLNPDILIWQSTPTPIVETSDGCATLAGQAPHGYTTARVPWMNFLRDGCPIDENRDPLPVGTVGALRCGDPGHPLQGIVDIAAAVEHGGTEAPSDKWRVDLGPLGGDGIHPVDLGMHYMSGPLSDWMGSLA